VLAKIPAAIAGKLKSLPILLAGTLRMGDSEHVFLLTVRSGNPTVVWFRERGGDPCGDAESWNVMLVRAEAKPADLLFVGGDQRQPGVRGVACAKASRSASSSPTAALTRSMAALVELRPHPSEFVETFCAPAELGQDGGEGRQDHRRRWSNASKASAGKQLVAGLFRGRREAGADPERRRQHWRPGSSTVPADMPKTLRLQRIDGRWYMRDR
jgi:hypothetical protein